MKKLYALFLIMISNLTMALDVSAPPSDISNHMGMVTKVMIGMFIIAGVGAIFYLGQQMRSGELEKKQVLSVLIFLAVIGAIFALISYFVDGTNSATAGFMF